MGSSPRGWGPGICEEHAGARHSSAGRGRGGVTGAEYDRCKFLPTVPNDTVNVNASSVLSSTSITSSGGTITRAPDVGLGVVGMSMVRTLGDGARCAHVM
jgi:hypothetical protein